MLRIRRLFEDALVRVERIDHPDDAVHFDPEEEESHHYSVNLLERGAFSICDRGSASRVTPAELFLTAPGKVHRYVHDEREAAPADVCVAVCFTDASRDEVSGLVESLRTHPSVVPINNRRAYLRQRLFDHLAAADTAIAVDLVSAELLASAFDAQAGRLYRPSQLSWYAKRIDGARRRLDEHFASDHSLAELARDAAMSPFHFARVFRELAGEPPHRYLLRRRLAAAARMLRDGGSVTDTCFTVGFRSLSHFIHAFRREFGVSPSRIRARR